MWLLQSTGARRAFFLFFFYKIVEEVGFLGKHILLERVLFGNETINFRSFQQISVLVNVISQKLSNFLMLNPYRVLKRPNMMKHLNLKIWFFFRNKYCVKVS